MSLKGMLKDLFFGGVVASIWGGAKTILTPLLKSAAEKGADKLGEEVVNKAKDLLDKQARDEQLLSEAKLLLTYIELQAWHEKFEYVDQIAIKADGAPDRKRAERLREFLRRLTIKASVEQTAEEMKYTAGMRDEVWRAHLRALDIEHKYEHPRFDSFKAWTIENAGSVVRKVSTNRTEVNDNIEQTAQDMRSWVDRFIDSRQP